MLVRLCYRRMYLDEFESVAPNIDEMILDNEDVKFRDTTRALLKEWSSDPRIMTGLVYTMGAAEAKMKTVGVLLLSVP
jgi:hypothetical protein